MWAYFFDFRIYAFNIDVTKSFVQVWPYKLSTGEYVAIPDDNGFWDIYGIGGDINISTTIPARTHPYIVERSILVR